MALQLTANPDQLDDLGRIVAIGPAALARVAESLERLPAPPLSTKALLDAVAAVIGRTSAEPLVRQLLGMQGFAVQGGHAIDDVLAGVRWAVEQQGESAGISLDSWRAAEPSVKALVEARSVRLPARAMDLAYDYTNLLRQTRIITDIRPLFDPPGKNIEAAVVSHTLRLFYFSSDGEHELSIAMNESEVAALHEQCERAIRKASEAKLTMESRCGIPTSICGEV